MASVLPGTASTMPRGVPGCPSGTSGQPAGGLAQPDTRGGGAHRSVAGAEGDVLPRTTRTGRLEVRKTPCPPAEQDAAHHAVASRADDDHVGPVRLAVRHDLLDDEAPEERSRGRHAILKGDG